MSLLGGCGGGTSPSPRPVFTGIVMGGLSPISGAAVAFYAAGDSGFGSTPIQLAAAITSCSGDFAIGSYTCPSHNPEPYG